MAETDLQQESSSMYRAGSELKDKSNNGGSTTQGGGSVGDMIQDSNKQSNLIVNYLPHDIDDNILLSLFAEHGEIAEAKVVRDRNTKKSMGYGFVKFYNEEDAASAIEMKNGLFLGNKRIKVSIARPPSEIIRNCKIYITNLPKTYTEQEVEELFGQYGEIIECRVLKDRNSNSNKGVAFVQYANKLQSDSALSLDGHIVPGTDRIINVKYAEDQIKKKERHRAVGLSYPGAAINQIHGLHGMSSLMSEAIGRNKRVIRQGQQALTIPQQSYYYDTQGTMILSHGTIPNSPMHSPHPHSPGSRTRNYIQQGLSIPFPEHVKYPSESAPIEWYELNSPMGGLAYEASMSPRGGSLIYEQVPVAIHSSHGSRPTAMYRPTSRAIQDLNFSGLVNLTVSFLPATADEAFLHELFAPFGGHILSVEIQSDVSLNHGSKSKGSSVVQGNIIIEGIGPAQLAVQALNGAILFEGCRPLVITMALAR